MSVQCCSTYRSASACDSPWHTSVHPGGASRPSGKNEYWPSSLTRILSRLSVAMGLLRRERLAEAQRPHVGPHLLDVRQALLLRADRPRVDPAGGVVALGGPDRVLLFVVPDDLVRAIRISFHGKSSRHDGVSRLAPRSGAMASKFSVAVMDR